MTACQQAASVPASVFNPWMASCRVEHFQLRYREHRRMFRKLRKFALNKKPFAHCDMFSADGGLEVKPDDARFLLQARYDSWKLHFTEFDQVWVQLYGAWNQELPITKTVSFECFFSFGYVFRDRNFLFVSWTSVTISCTPYEGMPGFRPPIDVAHLHRARFFVDKDERARFI